MKKILYITHDGILDHIGASQIYPYLKINSLSNKIYLLSFEKKKNFKDIQILKRKINQNNIEWKYITYHYSLFGKLYDFLLLLIYASKFIFFKKIDIIHCRSYIPTLSVFFINKIKKIKYIFDIRDFWADEGIEIKKYKFIYNFIKKIEGKMIHESIHTVCLTTKAKKYILNKYFKDCLDKYSNKITVIPCGTDFELFNPDKLKINIKNRIKKKFNPHNKNILLYYGSIGKNYLIDKKINFFKNINRLNEWKFIFLVNNNFNELNNYLLSKGLKNNNFSIINSKREQLPYFLSLANLSIFFYRQGMRSLGCSPTKLADLFSMNIPIITDKNLGDMDSIISFSKNNSLLISNFNSYQIRSYTSKILKNYKNNLNIRKNSVYFNYKYGAKKYLNIYKSL